MHVLLLYLYLLQHPFTINSLCLGQIYLHGIVFSFYLGMFTSLQTIIYERIYLERTLDSGYELREKGMSVVCGS